MKEKPCVIKLNNIQREWMALQCDAPDQEKRRVFKLMEHYPNCYVSGHDGHGVCVWQGSPCSISVPFEQAMARCKELGGRTDVAWNGKLWEWYATAPAMLCPTPSDNPRFSNPPTEKRNPNAGIVPAYPKGRW